jgi:hypothetical protein
MPVKLSFGDGGGSLGHKLDRSQKRKGGASWDCKGTKRKEEEQERLQAAKESSYGGYT